VPTAHKKELLKYLLLYNYQIHCMKHLQAKQALAVRMMSYKDNLSLPYIKIRLQDVYTNYTHPYRFKFFGMYWILKWYSIALFYHLIGCTYFIKHFKYILGIFHQGKFICNHCLQVKQKHFQVLMENFWNIKQGQKKLKLPK